jgi:hypothetical protein
MKPMMTLVATAMMMLSFQNQGGAQIKIQSPKIFPPLELSSTNLDLGLSNHPPGRLFQPLNPPPHPLREIPERNFETNFPSAQFSPGVYETKPYAMIVVVPGSGIDDRIHGATPNANSKMPVINPHIEAIPMSPAKP